MFKMASIGAGFDMGLGPAAFASISMDGDEYVRCTRCGYGGCDVRVSGCGCTLHAVSFSSAQGSDRLPRRGFVGQLVGGCLVGDFFEIFVVVATAEDIEKH